MAKASYDEIKAELKLFSEATVEKYQSYAFATGYFESTLASIMMDMPKHKQKELIMAFRKSAGEMVK